MLHSSIEAVIERDTKKWYQPNVKHNLNPDQNSRNTIYKGIQCALVVYELFYGHSPGFLSTFLEQFFFRTQRYWLLRYSKRKFELF